MTGESLAMMFLLVFAAIVGVGSISAIDPIAAYWITATAVTASLVVLLYIAFALYVLVKQLQWLNRLLSNREEPRQEFRGIFEALRKEASKVAAIDKETP